MLPSISFYLVIAKNTIPLGCWADVKNDRAMPIYIRNMRNEIDWKNIHLIVEKCMKEAVKLGKSFLACCRTRCIGYHCTLPPKFYHPVKIRTTRKYTHL